jgi:membrane protein implicated in regulation of membrane protease activity
MKEPKMNAEWLHWYYLIFWLPAAIAMLLLLMSGLGGQHSGHAHGHAHLGFHLHGPHGGFHFHGHHGIAQGAPAGAAAGHGPAGVHGTAAGHGHHGALAQHGAHQPGHSPGYARELLGFFGFGRAPVMILVGSMMIGWGLCGLAALEALRPVLRLPALCIGPALLAGAAGSLLSARLFASLAARFGPQEHSAAIAREGLVGLTGTVVYAVTGEAGRVHIFDQFRTLHAEAARVVPGTPPIEKGTEVIVAAMDPDRRYLIVEPLGFTTGRGKQS